MPRRGEATGDDVPLDDVPEIAALILNAARLSGAFRAPTVAGKCVAMGIIPQRTPRFANTTLRRI